MANTKVDNAVVIMGLGNKFTTDAVVQLNLLSNNPEDAYDILENDYDVVTAINLRTGKEITFEVGWSEVESVVLTSNHDKEEIYIDMLEESKSRIWMVDSPALLERKVLFGIDRYEVYECEIDDDAHYFLYNTLTNQTYEMIIETCFSLMTRYLNEDQHYILLEEFIQLEQQAVK